MFIENVPLKFRNFFALAKFKFLLFLSANTKPLKFLNFVDFPTARRSKSGCFLIIF